MTKPLDINDLNTELTALEKSYDGMSSGSSGMSSSSCVGVSADGERVQDHGTITLAEGGPLNPGENAGKPTLDSSNMANTPLSFDEVTAALAKATGRGMIADYASVSNPLAPHTCPLCKSSFHPAVTVCPECDTNVVAVRDHFARLIANS